MDCVNNFLYDVVFLRDRVRPIYLPWKRDVDSYVILLYLTLRCVASHHYLLLHVFNILPVCIRQWYMQTYAKLIFRKVTYTRLGV
jgi:hypothetical protein